MTVPIPEQDRRILRELAARVRDLAHLPVMAERTRLWYRHNAVQPDGRPPVIMELGGFIQEIMAPYPCRCESAVAREIEWPLLIQVMNHETVNDDKVISPYFTIPWRIGFKPFDRNFQVQHAKDVSGRSLGYAQLNHPVADLDRDLENLPRSSYSVDREATRAKADLARDLIGDILPIRIKNHSLQWLLGVSRYAIMLMGDEALMVAMAEKPEGVRRMYDRIRDELLAYMDWQEAEGLLTLNHENDFVGSGSYGFTHELPRPGSGNPVRMRDLWGNVNSQETICISPDMFTELVYPAYEAVAARFGLTYYGCCEPVHDLWEPCLCRLPNLRKVSISAWCNEARMGQYLRGGKVIYSRKPSPNYIGIGGFDETAFRRHIRDTLEAARGCPLEFIFRDIYKLNGDLGRAGRAVRIVRECIEQAR